MIKTLGLLALGLASAGAAHALEKDVPAAVDAIRHASPLVIDARRADELAGGMLPGALHGPHDDMAAQAATVAPVLDRPIVVYCRSGRRSDIATDTLRELGYTRVINGGGYEELAQALDAARRSD